MIKFSKPVILQFAKEDIIRELTISDIELTDVIQDDTDIVNSNTAALISSNEKFYIAGALHIAYSTEDLLRLAVYSRKKIMIFYYIAYLLAIIFGYFTGKHLEDSIKDIHASLNSIIRDENAEPFNSENRIDTFKKLQIISNRLIGKYEEYTEDSETKVSRVNKINDMLMAQFINNINAPTIITNELLKVEYINDPALLFLNKEQTTVINENLAEVLNKNQDIFNMINAQITRGLKNTIELKTDQTAFRLVPIIFNDSLKKMIIIWLKLTSEPDKDRIIKKMEPEENNKEVEVKQKSDKKERANITSRLKRI